MARTILVTGAAGFIGSHTAEALQARGDHVVGIDNFNDYYSPQRKRRNAEAVRDAGAELLEGDLRDGSLIADLFSRHNFDAVIHLAAMAGVRASVAEPRLYLDVNCGGTLELLEACRTHDCRRFVFASTSSVYGRSKDIPFREDQSCDRPLAPYPASKRAAELLGHAYCHLHRFAFTALRFFTVYGPRGRPDMMPYKVLDNIFTGREVPLYNEGKLHRDWTYVGDIVNGIVAATELDDGYQIINLGNGDPVLLADFIALLEALAGKKTNLRPEPLAPADVPYTFADIARARERLGYAPTVGVEEGTERFFRWYTQEVLGAL
ncbi:MAG: NAD-dependent epimerase/dehydratase family protein [Myxococcota bacterium]